MLLCSFTKKKTESVYPSALCDTSFHHALITCCNVSQAGYNNIAQMYHDQNTFDFSQCKAR